MSTGTALHPRALVAAVAVAAVTLASAGLALAAKQVKGATYVGHYKGVATEVNTEAISFKVSANGKKLTGLSVSTPFKCGGGCGGRREPERREPRGSPARGPSRSSSRSRRPGARESEGTDTVTGTFHAHGKAERHGHLALQPQRQRRDEGLDRGRLRDTAGLERPARGDAYNPCVLAMISRWISEVPP